MTHNEGDIGHCVNARSPTTRRIRGQRDASDQVVVTASSPPADTVDARTRRNSSRKSSPKSGEKIQKCKYKYNDPSLAGDTHRTATRLQKQTYSNQVMGRYNIRYRRQL